ncbi:unnamed protein product [Nesidiocoris tenuis]|uniref:Uncharacterized protein n=1 Tax=Nesidiocoris tenuis TaxID=355587 RepID=A0A6H5GU38_9HEMI|nr:unnamed protein product [Nesidiocoris tenuis]
MFEFKARISGDNRLKINALCVLPKKKQEERDLTLELPYMEINESSRSTLKVKRLRIGKRPEERRNTSKPWKSNEIVRFLESSNATSQIDFCDHFEIFRQKTFFANLMKSPENQRAENQNGVKNWAKLVQAQFSDPEDNGQTADVSRSPAGDTEKLLGGFRVTRSTEASRTTLQLKKQRTYQPSLGPAFADAQGELRLGFVFVRGNVRSMKIGVRFTAAFSFCNKRVARSPSNYFGHRYYK